MGEAPSPVAPSSSSEEDLPSVHASSDEEEVPFAHASSDEEVQEEQEQVEEDAVGPEVWLRGPSTLPKQPIPLERRLMIRPFGKK